MEKTLPDPLADTLNSLQAFPMLTGYDAKQQYDGYVNHTAILHVDGDAHYVVKTPLEDSIGMNADYVLTEALVVAHLHDASRGNPAPIELPEVIESQQQLSPYYSVFSYVPGDLLNMADLVAISDRNKIKVGKQLAEAVYWIEQQNTAEAVPEIKRKNTIPQHIARLNFLESFTNQHDTLLAAGHTIIGEAIALAAHSAKELFTPEYLNGNSAGHSDLYLGNVTFSVQPEEVSLLGIFDFGAMSVRPTEFELRHFDFLSAQYTEAFIDRYGELSGVELDAQRIALWSMIQALGPLTYRITRDIPLSGKRAWCHDHLLKEFYPRFRSTLDL